MTAKPRKQSRPIYMAWRQLIDPQTDAPRMALVAIDAVGQAQLKERRYRVGDRVRCELAQPRHYGNHKFAHKVGTLAMRQLPGFELCDTAHDAVKKLQQDSGVCCDVTTTDIPGVGRIEFKQPQSIAFDKMSEEVFKGFVAGICEHIRATYWPSMTVEQIAAMQGLLANDPRCMEFSEIPRLSYEYADAMLIVRAKENGA